MENSLLHGVYDERKCVLAVCEQNNPRMIKIIIKEENFKWHLEAFASELFKYSFVL